MLLKIRGKLDSDLIKWMGLKFRYLFLGYKYLNFLIVKLEFLAYSKFFHFFL